MKNIRLFFVHIVYYLTQMEFYTYSAMISYVFLNIILQFFGFYTIKDFEVMIFIIYLIFSFVGQTIYLLNKQGLEYPLIGILFFSFYSLYTFNDVESLRTSFVMVMAVSFVIFKHSLMEMYTKYKKRIKNQSMEC